MFQDEAAFWEAFERLNALSRPYREWETPTARKTHEDLFGIIVESGETYFKKQYGAAWGSDVKLSRKSMEKLFYAVVGTSPQMEQIADTLIENRRKRLLEALNHSRDDSES